MISSILRSLYKSKWGQAGFTIAELIVVFFIITVASAVIIGNSASYSEGAQLRNLTQVLGLDIRRAQVYGITVKEAKAGTSQFYKSFTNGYGITIRMGDVDTNGDLYSKFYLLYGDKPIAPYPSDPTLPLPIGNGIFNAGTISPDGWQPTGCNFDASTVLGNRNECIQRVDIPAKFKIVSICVIDAAGWKYCSNPPPGWTEDPLLVYLDITFNRPSTEARIIFNRDPTLYAGLQGAIIILSNLDYSKWNMVTVYKTGQISVQ